MSWLMRSILTQGGRLELPAVLTAMFLAGVGCQRAYTVHDNPLAIDAEEYDRVYDAALTVLKDKGFALDRQDHRFGQITTHALGSPTFVELWRTTNTTMHQMAQSTLNDEQRFANVFLERLHGAVGRDRYQLRVEVLVQRRQSPTRQMTGSTASRLLLHQLDDVPYELQQRGVNRSLYWQPIGRDPYLEQRLLADIINTSLAAADRGVVVPTDPQDPRQPRVDTTQQPTIEDIPSDADPFK